MALMAAIEEPAPSVTLSVRDGGGLFPVEALVDRSIPTDAGCGRLAEL